MSFEKLQQKLTVLKYIADRHKKEACDRWAESWAGASALTSDESSRLFTAVKKLNRLNPLSEEFPLIGLLNSPSIFTLRCVWRWKNTLRCAGCKDFTLTTLVVFH